jgi:xylulokinase
VLLYDLQGRRWDDKLLATFGVDRALFPQVLRSWQIAAALPATVAEQLSLAPGIPVVVGAADSQCAAYGAVLGGTSAPDVTSEMAVASSCLNSVLRRPLADERVTHYSNVTPDLYCTELGVNTTGAALDRAVRRLGYADHPGLAADAQRHARRLGQLDPIDAAPLFLPYLGDGERDDPALRGAFIGESDRHDRPALAFGVMEGVAPAVSAVLRELAAAGSPTAELRVGGGGAHSRLVGQLKAELLGLPVLHLDLDPAGFGVAMLAASASQIAGEAAAAISAAVARAVTLRPTRAGAAREAARFEWFSKVRNSAAVHRPAAARRVRA